MFFFEGCTDYQSIYDKYMLIRFLLRRMELGMESAEYRELSEEIKTEGISYEVVETVILHSVIDKKNVLEKLIKLYNDAGMCRQSVSCNNLYQIVKNGRFQLRIASRKKTLRLKVVNIKRGRIYEIYTRFF